MHTYKCSLQQLMTHHLFQYIVASITLSFIYDSYGLTTGIMPDADNTLEKYHTITRLGAFLSAASLVGVEEKRYVHYY